MTREQVNNALSRMEHYCKNVIKDDAYAAGFEFALNTDDEYKEAWIRAIMQFDIDDLDTDSKVWFLDENDYQAAEEILVEDYLKRKKFAKALEQELAAIG